MNRQPKKKVPISTIYMMGSKREIEVDRETGKKIEQAWKDGISVVTFDSENHTINTSGISEIAHGEKYVLMTALELEAAGLAEPLELAPGDHRGDTSGPGYQKYLAMRKKLGI